MFTANYKDLTLSFNEFHDVSDEDMPEYGEFCLLELESGDYKVSVTAGDRTAGGSRDFFITPYCFEAGTYGGFLDRYLEIVPEYSFGLGKKDLLPDKELKKFLGY